MLDLSSNFDGGSIEVLSRSRQQVTLAIPSDNASNFRQWFCFQARGDAETPRQFAIINASEASFPRGFEGYSVVASHDRRRWFRIPTHFDGEQLEFSHQPRRGVITYAYFAPYPAARRRKFLRWIKYDSSARVEVLGRTPQGHPLSRIVAGEEAELRHKVWVIARQHPGETMAEWFIEGMLGRLLSREDPLSEYLLEQAIFYVIPCMNPDGGILGNMRTNALGVDLNRSWDQPTEEGPEVWMVRERMHQEGVDLFLDIHGDERTPYCFLAGCEGNPGYSERIEYLEELFSQSLCEANPDFQREHGYPKDAPGTGDLRCASNYVGEVFDCLSFTLEMPFKDNANAPDDVMGWSPERSMRLGASILESIAASLGQLR